MLPRATPLLFLCAGTLGVSSAYAGDDVYGASRAGMGYTGVAAAHDDVAVTVNPGLLGLEQRYDIDAQAFAGSSGDLALGGSIVDSRTAPIGFGLTYQYDSTQPPLLGDDRPGWVVDGEEPSNWQRENEFTVGVGVPMLDRHLAVGLNASLGLYNYDRGGNGTTNDFDVGIAAQPEGLFAIGLVAQNIVPYNHEFDDPFTVSLGTALRSDTAELAVDGSYQLEDTQTPMSMGVGGALTPGDALLRAGYRLDGPRDQQWITWGLGAENDSGAIEYAMGVPLHGELTLGTLGHYIAIRIKT